MTDFLLELLSEEIPARMQAKARADLARLFSEQLAAAGLAADAIETFATPRRLALIARGLPLETAAVTEERKGPGASAPAQAIEGFLRSTGLSRDQLVEREDKKGVTLFAVVETPGRATASVLAEAIPTIVRAFPWPKSMRWGAPSISTESPRWVRPLQGIVALLGEEIVDCEVAGVRSGAATLGHRFHHPGVITIGGAHDYAEKLRACHVIVDPDERAAIIRDGARAAASAAGLALVEDEGLVLENAGLTEWPVPLLGGFDPAFLDVPREVIQLTMRTNQKYFACVHPPRDGEGASMARHDPGDHVDRAAAAKQPGPEASGGGGSAPGPTPPPSAAEAAATSPSRGGLAPNFICTANIDASDGGAAIIAGNQRVLSARLADAKFFWEQDLKIPLAAQAAKLDQIVFHEKLGTVADKVDRVAKLARWLVEEGVVGRLDPPRDGEGDRSPQASGGGGSETLRRPNPPRDGEGDRSPQASGGGGSETLRRPNPPRDGEGDRSPQASGGGGSARDTTPPPPAAPVPLPASGEDQERLAALAETAARLCKADLVTGLVGEFPELQGIIGGHLARAQGQPPQIADAIRDHYKPVGPGDEVPTAPVTVAASLADKLDTIIQFFDRGIRPTGSKDPFALRRSALAIVALIIQNNLRVSFRDVFAMQPLTSTLGVSLFGARDFFVERLQVQQRAAGIRHDVIEAAFGAQDPTLEEFDLVRLLARVKALQVFVETPEGADLLAGYKRAANILKKTPLPSGEGGAQPEAGRVRARPAEAGHPHPSAASRLPPSPGGRGNPLSYTPENEEAALIAALDVAAPRAAAAVDAEDFEGAMAALASLRGPVDAFFDKVTVNDPDADKRAARLALLARMRDAVHRVADFSRIEG